MSNKRRFDLVSKETGREVPKMIRLVVANPLIMKEMVNHCADARSYTVTILTSRRSFHSCGAWLFS